MVVQLVCMSRLSLHMVKDGIFHTLLGLQTILLTTPPPAFWPQMQTGERIHTHTHNRNHRRRRYYNCCSRFTHYIHTPTSCAR